MKIDLRYLDPEAHGLGFRSPVVRYLKETDKLVSASDFKDPPSRLTIREAEFCKLLIDLATQLGSPAIPVILETDHGKTIFDKGCMKMAAHRGFIKPLTDDIKGVVSMLELSFAV